MLHFNGSKIPKIPKVHISVSILEKYIFSICAHGSLAIAPWPSRGAWPPVWEPLPQAMLEDICVKTHDNSNDVCEGYALCLGGGGCFQMFGLCACFHGIDVFWRSHVVCSRPPFVPRRRLFNIGPKTAPPPFAWSPNTLEPPPPLQKSCTLPCTHAI